MNLHDKAQELVKREEQKLNERFRQLQKVIEQEDKELARLDHLIHEAEKAEQEMHKPITS